MAKFIPPINAPLEQVAHHKWLEKGKLDHDKEIEGILRRLAALEKQGAATNRQTNAIQSGESTAGGVFPPGGTPGQTLRKSSVRDGYVGWSRDWQGLMPEFWVTLNGSGGSYYVSAMGPDAAISQTWLPPVQFDDDGRTMLPIDFQNFGESVAGEVPTHLWVGVEPTGPGEEFTIYPPTFDNVNGPTSPFYTFEVNNIGSDDAVVNIGGTNIFYEGTLAPLMGDVDSWTIPSGFQAAWFVRSVKGWGSVAAPMVFWDGVTASFTDAYYEANVYTGP